MINSSGSGSSSNSTDEVVACAERIHTRMHIRIRYAFRAREDTQTVAVVAVPAAAAHLSTQTHAMILCWRFCFRHTARLQFTWSYKMESEQQRAKIVYFVHVANATVPGKYLYRRQHKKTAYLLNSSIFSSFILSQASAKMMAVVVVVFFSRHYNIQDEEKSQTIFYILHLIPDEFLYKFESIPGEKFIFTVFPTSINETLLLHSHNYQLYFLIYSDYIPWIAPIKLCLIFGQKGDHCYIKPELDVELLHHRVTFILIIVLKLLCFHWENGKIEYQVYLG